MPQALFSNKPGGFGHQAWETSPFLFAQLHEEFGFTLDAAASEANHLCPKFFTEETDGLANSWAGERVFCNPPFKLAHKFVEKAASREAEVSVLLVPANLQNRWWSEYALTADEVRFIKGRTWFFRDGIQGQAANPVGCVLLVWRGQGKPDSPSVTWGYSWPGRQNGWLTAAPSAHVHKAAGRRSPTRDGDRWSMPPLLRKALVAEVQPDLVVDGDYKPFHQDWTGKHVLAMPPVGDVFRWVEKAHSTDADISLLIPAAIDTTWWTGCIVAGASEVKFFERAIEFWRDGAPKGAVSPIATVLARFFPGRVGPPAVTWCYSPIRGSFR